MSQDHTVTLERKGKNKNEERNKIESNPKSFTIGTMSRKQMLTQTCLNSQCIPEKARYNFNFVTSQIFTSYYLNSTKN